MRSVSQRLLIGLTLLLLLFFGVLVVGAVPATVIAVRIWRR